MLLRELADDIPKPLLIVFERLWVLREVLKAWKKANVIHQEGQAGGLQAGKTHLNPMEGDHAILEAIPKHIKDKNVTGRSQHRFTRDILSDQ